MSLQNEISAPVPDYLGPTWQARTIFLTQDDGAAPAGKPDVAVLVAEQDAPNLIQETGLAALWLPGYLDSFMHVEQAQAWRAAGIALVGLDFRREGRAVRDPKHQGYIRDLLVREEEIAAALELLRSWGAERIVLIGHSMGGLQAALWADRHPGTVAAVILNSPWLEQFGPEFLRTHATRIIRQIAKVAPGMPIASTNPTYLRSLHVDYGGEFEFDQNHKLTRPTRIFAGLFAAGREAHAKVAAGLHIQEPVLVAHSDKSGNAFRPSPEDLAHTDAVTDVADIMRLGPTLGADVTMLEVPGGRHDLALSRQPARDFYTKCTVAWVRELLGI
ncbi:MAG: alpha/beta fold hydrolase [Trueperella sp.]|nr:alpha/beta fold hydrolase [Trueperella sp.]